jgi:P4 family phage/plasmid primase-like protien
MTAEKRPGYWGHITRVNFKEHINKNHNGLALITGHTHIMIDVDLKHNVPEDITNLLKANCKACERTPGGYHFYFKIDDRTEYLVNSSERYWNGVKIAGLDFRGKGGISYMSPTNYIGNDGDIKRYIWEIGNISTAEYIPDILFNAIQHPDNFTNSDLNLTTEEMIHNEEPLSDDKWNEIVNLVEMLSGKRATDYTTWRDVIFALKNTEYSDRMLELCHEFSKKSYKYDRRSVTKKFYGSRPKGRALTIKSLYYWAKQDSPDAYMKLKSKEKSIETYVIVCTNASIADLFYELNPDRYLFSSVEGWYVLKENNTWLATNSKDIKSIPNILNSIRDECKTILGNIILNQKTSEDNTISKLLGEAIKKISSSSFLKGTTDFLQGKYYIENIENKFNSNRDLLGFNNGVLNTKTFEFRETEPEDYITITTGYDYRVATESEKRKVKNFLSKIFPSEHVLNYILLALSTSLTGNNLYEFFHIFTGTGANGKSLLMDLCKIVLGDYFRTISVSYLTKDDEGKDKPLPDLVSARYTRMLVASEPEERDKFQTAFIKQITGNDELSCRGLYDKRVIKFVPQFKLWILANDIPKFTKYDGGVERRTRCVHFPTRFVVNPKNENEEKRDESLKVIIKEDESWKYGLLGLLVDALKSLNGKSLEMPKEVESFTEEYLLANNPVGAWLKKYYERTNNKNDIIQRTVLYNTFLQDTGTHKTQKSFSEDIMKCHICNKIVDGNRYYYGIVRKETIVEENE